MASKGPAGRKSKLTAEQAQVITEALLEGPVAHGYMTALWTRPRVTDLIGDLTGIRHRLGHVWRLLGVCGFSCQRPAHRAIEPDDKAIAKWQRVKWPEIKKASQ